MAGELTVAPETEQRLDPVLGRTEPQFRQAVDLVPREVVEGELRERLPTPESERFVEHLRGLGRRSVVERTLPVGDEPLEAGRVDLDGLRAQGIAGSLRDDGTAAAGGLVLGLEQAAQVRDIPLDRLGRRLRRAVAPQRLQDAVGRDHLAAVDQQEDEQGALAPRGQLDLPALAAA